MIQKIKWFILKIQSMNGIFFENVNIIYSDTEMKEFSSYNKPVLWTLQMTIDESST